MAASTSNAKEGRINMVRIKAADDEVVENGGVSPQLSVRTEDDACSEIIRIEQEAKDDESTAVGRIVKTLQVGTQSDILKSHVVWLYNFDPFLNSDFVFKLSIPKSNLVNLVNLYIKNRIPRTFVGTLLLHRSV